jgi:hypothetical protein
MPTTKVTLPPASVIAVHGMPSIRTDSAAERAWAPAYNAPARQQ